MRKLWLWMVGCVVLAAGVAALNAQDQPEKKETPKKKAQDPISEGRPLSVWLLQLKDPDKKARQQATEAIAKLRKAASSVTPTALEMLKDEKDEYNRQLGAYLLAYIRPDPKQVAAALVDALRDKDASVRRMASVALSAMSGQAKSQTPALVDLLSDKEADTRQLAAFVLGNINPNPQAVVAALKMAATKDESELVRRSAGEALKKIDPAAAASAGIQ